MSTRKSNRQQQTNMETKGYEHAAEEENNSAKTLKKERRKLQHKITDRTKQSA